MRSKDNAAIRWAEQRDSSAEYTVVMRGRTAEENSDDMCILHL